MDFTQIVSLEILDLVNLRYLRGKGYPPTWDYSLRIENFLQIRCFGATVWSRNLFKEMFDLVNFWLSKFTVPAMGEGVTPFTWNHTIRIEIFCRFGVLARLYEVDIFLKEMLDLVNFWISKFTVPAKGGTSLPYLESYSQNRKFFANSVFWRDCMTLKFLLKKFLIL